MVPAYNEALRLPATLEEIGKFVDESTGTIEVLLVDDGSTDSTSEIMQDWCTYRKYARKIRISHSGKAHAVWKGIREASQSRVLFMDADLAVPLSEISKLTTELDAGADVAIGSREMSSSQRADESIARHFRGRLFNWFVALLAIRGIRDTQCGFKAFQTKAIQHIYAESLLYRNEPTHLRRPSVTAFDVELLFLARRLGYTIKEIGVNWRHIPNSKVDPIRDPLRMALEVLRIRINAFLGRYP